MHLNIVFTMNNYVKNFLKSGHDRILTMSIVIMLLGKVLKVILFAGKGKYKSLF